MGPDRVVTLSANPCSKQCPGALRRRAGFDTVAHLGTRVDARVSGSSKFTSFSLVRVVSDVCECRSALVGVVRMLWSRSAGCLRNAPYTTEIEGSAYAWSGITFAFSDEREGR